MLACALLFPVPIGSAGSEDESHAPAAVVLVPVTDDAAVLAWTPGAVPAERFVVYGLGLGEPSVVDTVSGETGAGVLVVERAYPTFGVAAIRLGVETPIVPAFMTPDSGECYDIVLQPPPPDFALSTSCLPPPLSGYRPPIHGSGFIYNSTGNGTIPP